MREIFIAERRVRNLALVIAEQTVDIVLYLLINDFTMHKSRQSEKCVAFLLQTLASVVEVP